MSSRLTTTPTMSMNSITVMQLEISFFLLGQVTLRSSATMFLNALAMRPGRLAIQLISFLNQPCFSGVFFSSAIVITSSQSHYLVSRWEVCFLQKGQYFFSSTRSGVFFLFFMLL